MGWSPHPGTDTWADAMVELEVVVPDEVAADACAVCGRLPAAPARFTALEGYLVLFRRRSLARRLCRSCAVGAFREHQSRTWARGFWGVPAVLMAPFVLVANLRRLRACLWQLEPPRPTGAGVEPGLRGRPVWARPGPWVPVAVALVAAGVAYAITVSRVTVDGLEVGECFEAPAGTSFGPGTGTVIIDPVPCLEPHLHQVAARDDHPAVEGTRYPGLLDLDEEAFELCLDAVPPEVGEAIDRALGVVYPSPRAWERGERTVTCIVSSRTGPVVGSLIE